MTTKHSLLIMGCIILLTLLGYSAGIKQAEINQLRANNTAMGECKHAEHTCSDSTHGKCDGMCKCDGMGCAYDPSTEQPVLRDYQIEYHMDTVWVYSGSRLLGTHIDSVHGDRYFHGSFIDSLIMADNL